MYNSSRYSGYSETQLETFMSDRRHFFHPHCAYILFKTQTRQVRTSRLFVSKRLRGSRMPRAERAQECLTAWYEHSRSVCKQSTGQLCFMLVFLHLWQKKKDVNRNLKTVGFEILVLFVAVYSHGLSVVLHPTHGFIT